MSALSNYLSSRKQRRVLQLLHEHSGRCKAVAHTFGRVCNAWAVGNVEDARIYKEKIHSEEKSADRIEIELIKEVAQSELPDTKMKEELIAFVRLLDSAAGSAKRSATNMLLLIDYPLPEKYQNYVKDASEIIATLFVDIDKAIKSISDPEKIEQLSKKIDLAENKMDKIYSSFKDGYFEIEKTFNSAAALILLDHVTRDMEECADRCEDAIELLVELVQRRF